MAPRRPLRRDRELTPDEFVYDATTLGLQVQVQFPEGPRMLPFAVISQKPKWIDYMCAGCLKFVHTIRSSTVGYKRLTGKFYCHDSLLDSTNHACDALEPNTKNKISKKGISHRRAARDLPPSSSSSVSVHTADSATKVGSGRKYLRYWVWDVPEFSIPIRGCVEIFTPILLHS
ncbi:hypothetical protein AAVH_32023 [Aphelenchoides avenae]|nr:hypothetical protein AAVH_32023 [Aphelenchus avenae]